MMTGTRIRRATGADARAIVRLFGASFEPEFFALLHYATAQSHRYIAANIEGAAGRSSCQYTVAEEDRGHLLGACELRYRPAQLFLNYIAVSEAARGRGIGRALIQRGIGLLGERASPQATFGLDVFDHNRVALQWYERLGLQAISSFAWYKIADPGALSTVARGGAGPYSVTGVAQAEIVHSHLGFSEFMVETADGPTTTVGRLGDAWFRLIETDVPLSPAVLPILRELDPARGVFLVARPSRNCAPGPTILSGHRLEAPLRTVLQRIERVSP